LQEQDTLRLLEQIELLYRDEPEFLSALVREDEKEDDEMKAFLQTENHNTTALQHIANFDSILGKAC